MNKEQNARILIDLLEYLKEQHSNLPTHVFEVLGEVIDDLKQQKVMNIIVISINFTVKEFNKHYCILQYDDERTLKLYSFDKEYKTIKEYYEQSR